MCIYFSSSSCPSSFSLHFKNGRAREDKERFLLVKVKESIIGFYKIVYKIKRIKYKKIFSTLVTILSPVKLKQGTVICFPLLLCVHLFSLSMSVCEFRGDLSQNITKGYPRFTRVQV